MLVNLMCLTSKKSFDSWNNFMMLKCQDFFMTDIQIIICVYIQSKNKNKIYKKLWRFEIVILYSKNLHINHIQCARFRVY